MSPSSEPLIEQPGKGAEVFRTEEGYGSQISEGKSEGQGGGQSQRTAHQWPVDESQPGRPPDAELGAESAMPLLYVPKGRFHDERSMPLHVSGGHEDYEPAGP